MTANPKAAQALSIQNPARSPLTVSTWDFNRDHIQGGRPFLEKAGKKGYLIPGAREKAAMYESRLKRAHYINFPKEFVARLAGFIFRDSVQRPDLVGGTQADPFNSFWSNVDGRGTPISVFMAQALENFLTVGPHYVLVDLPRIPPELTGKPLSTADADAAGIRPVLAHVKAEDLLDWDFAEDGALAWAKIAIHAEEVRPWTEKPKTKTKPNILVYDRKAWTYYGPDGTVLEQGPNPLGRVPLIPIHPDFFGDTPLADAFILTNRVFNLDSEIQQASQDLIFSFLAKEGDGLESQMDGSSERPGEDGQNRERGRVVFFEKTAPQFVAPPSDILRGNLEYRATLLLELYRMAMLQSSLRQTAQAETAEAKRRDFQDTAQGLATLAGILQNTENGIRKDVALAFGVTDPPRAAVYPREFDVAELAVLLREAVDLFQLPVGTPAKVEVLRGILERRLDSLDPVKKAEVFKGMETAVAAAADLRSILPDFGNL